MSLMSTPFFYHPRMTAYDFGPQHPLKPERLRLTMALLAIVAPEIELIDPGSATDSDLLRIHCSEYIEVVRRLSASEKVDDGQKSAHGFSGGDNPPFSGMYEASLAYVGGSVRAAEAIRDGQPLAFNLAGGLHHARYNQASGFCIFNDCAIACTILRERFDRIAYVDIDLHHGDGVQWLFYDDSSVMTCSIHESGNFLYPGTGSVEETGADFSSVNAPLAPMTTGDTWLTAFQEVIMTSLKRFQPEAIVLQMGADPHFLDPLGHLQVSAQEWLEAVQLIKSLDLPTVALGGGGYEMTTVPRMWVAATLTLLNREVPNRFFDSELPQPRNQGQNEAEQMIVHHRKVFKIS